MTDEATIQADAQALVAMTVADLAAHLDTVDLDTLKAALEAEQAKGDSARRGAIAALTAAINGHPEQAEAAAEAAEAGTDSEKAPTDDADASEPATPASDGTDEAAAESDDAPASPQEQESAEEAEPVDELSDKPASPDAVSAAPPRPHQSIVDQLEIRWFELRDFVSDIEGTVEGDLGDLLQFVRDRL